MKKEDKKTLAIYIRVSTPQQAEKGMSMHNQEMCGIELAKKIGWQYEVFKDAGITAGLPFKERPALNEIVDRIFAGEIQGIFSIEIDRLTRNVTDGNVFLSMLIEKNTMLYDDKGLIDIQNEDVEFITRLKIQLADRERRGIGRKVKTNLKRRVMEGKAPGGQQAFGYGKDENDKLIINEKDAEIVRKIFSMANTRHSLRAIVKYLNDKGIKNSNGGRYKENGVFKYAGSDWVDATIHRLLIKTQYKGKLLHGDNGKEKGHKYTREFYDCPAIIDPILFDNVQIQMAERNKYKAIANEVEYLLKGLIVCGECGDKYYVRKKSRYNKSENAYACNSGRKGKSCGHKSIKTDLIEKIIVDNVYKFESIIEQGLGDKNLLDHLEHYKEQSVIAKDKLKTLETEMGNLMVMGAGLKVTPKVFSDRLEAMQIEMDELTKIDNANEAQLTVVNHKESILEVCRQGVNSFKKMKDVKEKIDFIRSIIRTIDIVYSTTTDNGNSYAIKINFKINQLENYLITNELVFSKPKKKEKLIITENITIGHFMMVVHDTMGSSYTNINYTDYEAVPGLQEEGYEIDAAFDEFEDYAVKKMRKLMKNED